MSSYSWSQLPKLGKYERCWALTHPFAALKVKRITKECKIYSDQISIKSELDGFSNGGKLDAYRHSLYMAACAQKIKVRKLRRLGIAHEKTNYRQFLKSEKEEGELADSLSSVMDLFNNELGFKIGFQNKKIFLEHISELVIDEIKKGNALIMKRNRSGAYLDCEGNLIDLKKYNRTWNIPKCLVSSKNN
ncbi:DUF6973 domain-containing protein [Aurantibacillus circumpalustris]|uniref:DUF6973 domain-containing protein n=1 Tax=Aurantibacillus circumpalustris TaxID=3036359 RepID=UPI00295B02B0|nr:hypothetical protein [Aurantibacillus circumpalustris]